MADYLARTHGGQNRRRCRCRGLTGFGIVELHLLLYETAVAGGNRAATLVCFYEVGFYKGRPVRHQRKLKHCIYMQ